ncbi:MAG TPA: enolase C-terminal domain-like protein [Burkholderiales bacterium]|nr:enolase C-terminal domain-like protein [Burkholderiales bacterium]
MAPGLKIRNIRARPVLVPFKRPPMSASGGIPSAALVLIDLETDGGVTGRAYVFGFAPWTLKPIVGCVEGLADMIKGDALAPLEIEAKLRKRLTLLDTPGLTGLALAGIDMAAWDALAIANGLPLVKLLGGEVRPVRAYNSCGLWIQPVEKVADDAEQLVAEGNFSAVKLRIGRDDPAQDLAAARAVKKRVGDRISVMSDFNQRLSVNDAILRGRMLDDEGLYWIEEPTRHDDYAGYARICAELQTPIQTGENLVDTFEMVNAIALESLDYVMPDLQRIGGVTGWLRAAALAHAHGIEMSSHLFPEFSCHLLAVTPTCHWLEYVDWAAPILQEPAQVKEGDVIIPDRPGAGIVWNEEAVKRYAA